MKALVVEDMAYESELLEHYLTEAGFQVTVTGLLSDAIETALAQQFDVITLDLRLRDSTAQNTLAAIQTLKSASGGCPIIVVTGYASEIKGDARNFIDTVIYKPWHQNDLVAAVKTAVTRDIVLKKKLETV